MITCPDCDWTDTSTGDRLSDAMLLSAHSAEAHMTQAEAERIERQAANPNAWYD